MINTNSNSKHNIMSHNFFISHYSKDKPIAELFSNALRRITLEQINPWFSSDNLGGLKPGDIWFNRIISKINQSKAVVSLLTPNSINRPWIYFESGIGQALENCEVIPVCIGLKRDSILPPLGLYQCYQLNDYRSVVDFFSKLLALFEIKFDEEMSKGVIEKFVSDISKINFEKEENNKEKKDDGTLRACFMNYPPACMKDAKTGKMSGIFVDILQKVCDNIGKKLEWTEEVGWESQIDGLESDRFDIVGSPVWANSNRGKLTIMSIPLYHSPIGVFVRANETRFSNLDLINSPNVRIGTIDGESAELIAKEDYPKAKIISSPQTTTISQILHNLATNQCDVVFTELYFAYEYLKKNPGTIKNITVTDPIRFYGNRYMIKKDKFQLQQTLNIAIQELIDRGYVDKVRTKYEPTPLLFFRDPKEFEPFNFNTV